MLVSGHAGSDPQSLIHYLLSKASRTPGRNGNSRRGGACCGPPEGVRSARLCESQEQSIHSPPMTIRFGLRAPGVGRRPSAHARRFYEPQKHGPKHNQKLAPNLSGSACRPLPRAAKPLGNKAGDLKVARATTHSPPSFSEVRPRRVSPRANIASLRPRTAILRIALFALSL